MSARGVNYIDFSATNDGNIGIIIEISAEPWNI